MNEKRCGLCGGAALLRYKKMKGYIEETFFDIYECVDCDVSFVSPLLSDKKIYEHIYQQAKIVPGYERYHRYSELVKKVSNPLSVLCNSESVYWAVKKILLKYFPKKEDVLILEIGSGLGYFTYSLNKFGYKTIGLDVSKDAVKQATEKYGKYYEFGDLFILAKNDQRRYDCVIMTEIIEHVDNPKDFIKAAISLLKKDGKLIFTTPNKSAAPKNTIWQSDIPPVHLWFFAEKSILRIADEIGKKCELVDFTDYTKKFFSLPYAATMDQIQAGLPRLKKNGEVKIKAGRLKTLFFGLRGRYYLSYIRRRLKSKKISNQTTTLCAVYH